MTSDGISDSDWDHINELACNVANSAIAEDELMTEIWETKLLEALDILEREYGTLPSIIATRADYIDDLGQKQKLFEQAYAQALTLSDGAQLLLISQSMSELMIEEIGNRQLGQKWITEYEKYIETDGDESAVEQFNELKALLNKL